MQQIKLDYFSLTKEEEEKITLLLLSYYTSYSFLSFSFGRTIL